MNEIEIKMPKSIKEKLICVVSQNAYDPHRTTTEDHDKIFIRYVKECREPEDSIERNKCLSEYRFCEF